MKHKYRKLSFITAFIFCVTLSFGSLGAVSALEQEDLSNEETANDEYIVEPEEVAEEDMPDENVKAKNTGTNQQPAIEVYLDSELKAAYTMEELKDANNFEQKQFVYSSFNSWPTAYITTDVEGVAIEDILNKAGLASLDGNQTIEFATSDGARESFLVKQIFAKRYYFPNIKNEAGRAGKAALASSKSGAQVVPALLRLNEPNSMTGRLYFGQLSPTEQNHSHYLKYTSRITVHSLSKVPATSWNALNTTSAGTGGAVRCGTVITLNRNINATPSMPADRYCVYYTTDGSTPNMSSNIYNYNNFYAGTAKEKFNKPIVSYAGNMTIKTKVIGYGKQDSAVSTFSFNGVIAPPTPKITKITAKKKALTLKWKKIKGVNGYKIYRSTSRNGSYSLVKTITKAKTVKWKNKKLQKKRTYYYKIVSYKIVSGRSIDSNYSAVKYKKTK